MSDCLKVKDIVKNKNRVDFYYEIEGKWKELLKKDENLFIEYSSNIENVPDSLMLVPFLCNVLPISWVFNLNICVDDLDEDFYNCIEDIKLGYSNMYPKIKMLGNIEATNLVKNNCINVTKVATLFSGGVDAFNTLFSHIDEKPSLLTVWGADINLEDNAGWKIVNDYHTELSKQFNIDYLTIKTNFRTFINYNALSNYVSKIIKGEWWHEFQHGIGMIGLSAPLAYVKGFKTVYIASSYTIEDRGNYTCASDPTIDNYLKFSDCKVIHDGYQYNRQDKIHNICNFIEKNKEKIKLRVCWESSGGKNCCYCEKCYRTILGIMSEKKDPRNYGFDLNNEKREKMMMELPKYVKYNLNQQYSGIQRHFIKNYTLEETPQDLIWFRNIKIKNKKPAYIVLYENIINKLKNIKLNCRSLCGKIVRKMKNNRIAQKFKYTVENKLIKDNMYLDACDALKIRSLLLNGKRISWINKVFKKRKYNSICYKNNSSIPLESIIGDNLTLPHGLTGIFISMGARIGNNCTIFQQVTIGSNTLNESKTLGAPTIGDNVYIGAGAKIIGGINIGNNVRIGANCVVVEDVPDNATIVLEHPRIIKHKQKRDNSFKKFTKN